MLAYFLVMYVTFTRLNHKYDNILTYLMTARKLQDWKIQNREKFMRKSYLISSFDAENLQKFIDLKNND